jgi:hypothetical protein
MPLLGLLGEHRTAKRKKEKTVSPFTTTHQTAACARANRAEAQRTSAGDAERVLDPARVDFSSAPDRSTDCVIRTTARRLRSRAP